MTASAQVEWGANAVAGAKSAKESRSGMVNRELLVILSIFVISAVINVVFESQRMVLGLYILPTIYSAYHYGRRHAVLTAILSAFLVVLLTVVNPGILQQKLQMQFEGGWFDIAAWSGLVVVTAYSVGTLHERNQAHLRSLRESYQGILLILQHITSDQKYSQNHPYRVSMCATKIAEEMKLDPERVEDVRACGLLHEIEKLGISRDLLQQAAGLSGDREAQPALAASGGSLRRIVSILRAFEQACQSEGNEATRKRLPIEARILHVADVYDSMTSAKKERISPSEAMERIAQRAGLEYDSDVVDAFVRIFRRRAAGATVGAV